MVDRRDAELVMRVKDLATAEFKKIAKSVEEMNRALAEQVEGARTGKVSISELKDSLVQLQKAEQGLLTQQGMIDRLRALTKQANDEAAAVQKAKAALEAHAASLGTGATAGKAFERQTAALGAAVDKAERALQRTQTRFHATAKDLRELGIETKNLGVAQAQLANTAAQVGQSKTVLSAAIGNYSRNLRLAKEETKALAQEQRNLAGVQRTAAPAQQPAPAGATPRRGRGGETGLFGLRGFELQNLGYQVNDIATQLAGGTGIGQVIGQQGGQILQIFNRNLFDLIKLIPRYSGLIAIATTATLAYLEAARQVASNREFRSELLATTSGIAYQADQLTAIRSKVRDFGVAWADAGEAIKVAIGAGLSQDRVQQFLRASQDISDRTGGKVPEIFKGLTEGFSAGYEAIIKLNDQYKFLTASQAESLRAMYENGEQAKASAQAFELLKDRQRAAAEEGMGPWARALREVSITFRQFISWLSDTAPIQAYGAYLNWLAGRVGALAKAMRELASESDAGAADRMQTQLDRAVQNRSQMVQEARRRGQPADTSEVDATIRELTAGVMASNRRARASDAPPTGALFNQTPAGQIGGQDYLNELRKKRLEPAQNDDQRIRAAGIEAVNEAMRRNIPLTETLTKQIREEAEATARADILVRRHAEAQQKAADRAKDGANAAAIQAAGIRARNAAVAAGIENYEALNKEQERGEKIERERLARLKSEGKAGAAAARQEFGAETSLMSQLSALNKAGGARGLVDLDDRLREIDDRFVTLARNIQAFRAAGGTSVGGDSLGAFEGKAAEARDRAKALESVRFQEEEINKIIQERNAQVQAYTNLGQTGAITLAEAQERIAAAYKQTAPEIEAAVAALEKLIGSQEIARYLRANQLDLYKAKAQQYRTDIRQVDPMTAGITGAASQAFSSSAVQGIENVTKAIAEAATQTGNWGNVFRSLGTAALGILQSITQAIAKVIFEMYAARAASSVMSGLQSGAGVLGGIGKFLGLAGGIAGGFSIPGAVPAGGGVQFNVLHGGGIVGHGGQGRLGGAHWLAHAPRYHGGGMVGLRPDEQAAVLQKGEEVLTRGDPRHAMNGGGGRQDVNIRNVLLFDEKAVAGAMASAAGERVILDVVRTNVNTIRQMVGT